MRVAGQATETEDRVAGLLAAHGLALRRVARRWSLCEEDAEDALQRSLEIYVRRLATVERATEAAWLKVVIRHEALAIRRARRESVTHDDVDLDARSAADVRALDDRLAARERSARSAEALRELKHDEALALLLKAKGHSYQEIAASQGWTYTKVNRAITEGRARFLRSFRAIEEGEACERLAPALAALAAGSATAAQLTEARPHLRHCTHCRAALRALHAPLRRRVAALLPLGPVLTPVEWARRQLAGAAAPDPSGGAVPDVHHLGSAPPDAALPLHPLGIPDVEDTVAGHVERAGRLRAPSPRDALQGLLHRITGSDLVTGVQVAAGSGGGRTAAVAALLGVCLSGVGAGTYCAATALLPDRPAVETAHRPATRAPAAHRRTAARTTPAAHAAKPRLMAVATAAPPATPSPRPAPARQSRPRSQPSVSPARREFGFESAAGSPGPAGSTPSATAASSGRSGGSGRASGSGAGGSGGSAGGEFLP